jgi:hypothetical protein
VTWQDSEQGFNKEISTNNELIFSNDKEKTVNHLRERIMIRVEWGQLPISEGRTLLQVT